MLEPLFSWVHLSDIHIGHGSADHRWDQKLVLDALKSDIQRQVDTGRVPGPKAIFVTGDIGFSGGVLRAEYDAAREWLTSVAHAIGLGPEQVFVVPGNHDVQRITTIEKDADTWRLLASLRARTDSLDSALGRAGDRGRLELRLANYRAFAGSFAPVGDDLFWAHSLPQLESGLRVRLVGLNTALLCNDDKDHGALRLGTEQIHKAFNPAPEPDEIVIVMSHHPLRGGWLFDEVTALPWIQKHAHIHLSGHMHQADTQRVRSGGGVDFVEVVAGAAHSEELPLGVLAGHRYSFGAIMAEGRKLQLRVWPRVWSKRNGFRLDVDNVPDDGNAHADHELRIQLPGQPPREEERKRRDRDDRIDPGGSRIDEHREDFLDDVLRICKMREEAKGRRVEITTKTAAPPFHAYADILTVEPLGQTVRFAVGALRGAITAAQVELFSTQVHRRYQRPGSGVFSQLVYEGASPPKALVREAHQKGIWLKSLAEYQGLIDFQPYTEQLVHWLERDPVYPPRLYVPQRARLSAGDGVPRQVMNALDEVDGLLASPSARFVLVLGDFGTGKTFLLHELARLLAARQGPPYPMLVEMRSLEKAHSLDELVTSHLSSTGMERFDLPGFRYMLGQGLIALLFDGFDELALRVRYERAADHFETLIHAVQGNAKVVLTSRTQHFYSDAQVHTGLAKQFERIVGHRVVKLSPFSPGQIRHFLVNYLQDEEAADARVQLLDDVKDLLRLSENPRLLSFIAAIPVEELVEARDRTGKITAAGLYQKLLDRWFANEQERVNLKGAALGLTVDDRWKAVTALALRLWARMEPSVNVSELPAAVGDAITDLTTRSIESEEAAHQVGSGTLLVRDAKGNFSFLHASVLEWLVARVAAEEVRRGGNSTVLWGREMSDLMAEFFTALAGRDPCIKWANQALGALGNEIAKSNALRVLNRLGVKAPERVNLAGQDLRGQDHSLRNLRGADLTGADLCDATLIETDLTGASLAGAKLMRADLSRARLVGANLEGADLSSARLLGADLLGAKLAGAKLRYAQLLGVSLEAGALGGLDTFGSAPPQPSRAEVITSALATRCIAVTFSPDGALLASAHGDGCVRLWDVASGSERRLLQGHAASVRSVAFSPDGATLASGSSDKTVRLWDLASGSERRNFNGHADSVWSVAFSPDGASLASGSDDKTVRLWDVASGSERRLLEGHVDSVWSVAFSPDGATLASGSSDKTVRLWDVASGSERRLLEGHVDSVWSVAFSPDGATLASGSSDKTVRLWDVASGSERRLLEGHVDSVWSVAFNPDGATLASGSSDKTVRLWDVASGSKRRLLQGHVDYVRSVAFNPDGATLAAGSDDYTIRLWDVASGSERHLLQGHADSVWSVAFNPDGAILASGSSDKTVRLWDVASGSERCLLKGHADSVLSVAFSSDGVTLASGSSDKTVRLWDLASGAVRRLLKGHANSVWSVAFSPDGATLASTSDDRTVRLWDVASGSERRLLQGHVAYVRSVAFSPDGATLASGSDDNTARLWDVASGAERRLLQGHADYVRSVAFSPDGVILASGSSDKTVRLWDVASGSERRLLQGHAASVRSVAFSSDGATVASGSEDKTVRLWDVASGSERRRLQGHAASVLSVAFSPGGGSLASASRDGTIRLWDVTTGACLVVLVHRAEGWAAFTPDGCRYKMGGDIAGSFWYAIGLCRFEPGELDPYLPPVITRVPDNEPLLLPDTQQGRAP